MAAAIAGILAVIFGLLTLAILALSHMGVCLLSTEGLRTILVNVLLGALGALFSLVTLAALVYAVLLFAAAATCDQGEFFCEHGGSEWGGLGLFWITIASLAGILTFALWQALRRRILRDPDAWWLWFEKRRTKGPTVTSEWLREVNRRRARKLRNAREAR